MPTKTPASASPVLAPETLADSLASAAARSCAGPQSQPHLWPSVLRARPYGLPLHPPSHGPPLRTTGQKCEQRGPAPLDTKPRPPDCELSAPPFGTLRFASCRNIADWRPGGERPSAAKASGPAQDPGTEPGGKQPRAQITLRFVRDCHEGCFRLQTRELLSAMPARCRFPLAREPLGTRVPAASSQVPCRGRNTGDLRRPGALKITASCVQRPLRAWHESLLAVGCPDPAPPPTAQCSRQSLRHPSRQPLSPLV